MLGKADIEVITHDLAEIIELGAVCSSCTGEIYRDESTILDLQKVMNIKAGI